MTKARKLLALSDGGLPSQLSLACMVKPDGALLQALAMGRILFPSSHVGQTAPVVQQKGVPVLATTDAAILRLEAANAGLHVVAHQLIVRARDSAGCTQPEDVRQVWNWKGCLNNALHRVNVVIQ